MSSAENESAALVADGVPAAVPAAGATSGDGLDDTTDDGLGHDGLGHDDPDHDDADEPDVFALSDRTPLQALAGAYADRLASIRSGADAEELADSAALIAGLERMCLRSDGRRVRGR